MQIKRLLAALAISALIAASSNGCAALDGEPGRVVRGKNGSELRIAWSAGHRRIFFKSYQEPRSRTGLAVDRNGGVYLLDRLATARPNRQGIWLRKYLSSGKIAWTYKNLPPAERKLLPQALAVDQAGHPIAVSTAVLGKRGIFIQKFNSSGGRLWGRLIPLHPEPGVGPGFMLAIDKENNIYAAGTIVADGLKQAWLAKIGPTGEPVWEKRIKASNHYRETTNLIIDNNHIVIDIFSLQDSPFSPVEQVERHVFTSSGRELPEDQARSYGSSEIENWLGNQVRVWPSTAPPDPNTANAGGLTYTVKSSNYNIWFEINGSAVLRAQVARVAEKPESGRLTPVKLIADRHGNAYLAVRESGRGDTGPSNLSDVTKLYKLEIKPPSPGKQLRAAARRALRSTPKPFLPAVSSAEKAVPIGATQKYLRDIRPRVRELDREISVMAESLAALSSGNWRKARFLLSEDSFHDHQASRQPHKNFGLLPTPTFSDQPPTAAKRLNEHLTTAAEEAAGAAPLLRAGVENFDRRSIEQAGNRLAAAERALRRAGLELKKLSTGR